MLSFTCGDCRLEFLNVAEFQDPDAHARILEECSETEDVPSFVVSDLLGWADSDRERLFDLIGSLEGPYQIKLGDSEHSDLFSAVLDALEGPEDPLRSGRGYQAAVAAAALCQPGHAQATSTSIVNRLKELGCKGYYPQNVGREIKDLVAQQDSEEEALQTPLAMAERYLALQQALAGMSSEERPLNYFQGDFFRWTGSVWRRISDLELESQITRYLQLHEPLVNVTRTVTKNVWENLTGLCLIDGWDDLRLPLWVPNDGGVPERSPYLSFTNGLVDLQKLLHDKSPPKVQPTSSQHFSPVLLPYAYEPEAKCPLWEQMLDRILKPTSDGDKRVAVLQEAFGWCLLSGDHNINLERFFILQGKGSNGKSTMLKVLNELLGKENVSHVALESFNGNFRLYGMADKLANISLDMNRPERVEEGILKTLVSGEPVQVDRKYKDPVTIYPTAKLIFAANDLPAFGDRSDGLWRRAVIVPFLVQIPLEERNLQLFDELKNQELPGILNWAVAGAKRLIASRAFTHCSACEKANEDHRLANDHFLTFVGQCLAWTDSRPRGYEDLYLAYKPYCEDYMGVRASGRPKFEQRLQEYISERQRDRVVVNVAAQPQFPHLQYSWYSRLNIEQTD